MKLIRSKLSLARFLTTISTPKKYAFTCIDGPWKNSTLYLCSGSTLTLNIRGRVGSYQGGGGRLYWKES